MSVFEKRFKLIMEQDDTGMPVDDIADDQPPVPVSQNDADTIDAVDDVPTNPGVNYKKEMNSAQTAELQSWIGKIDDFKNYLNGTDDSSMQSKINKAECDSLFNEISRSETKKISRIAQDLSGLVESLKGYLLSHEDE